MYLSGDKDLWRSPLEVIADNAASVLKSQGWIPLDYPSPQRQKVSSFPIQTWYQTNYSDVAEYIQIFEAGSEEKIFRRGADLHLFFPEGSYYIIDTSGSATDISTPEGTVFSVSFRQYGDYILITRD